MGLIIEVIPEDLMRRFSQKIAEEMGLEYPPDRWEDLRRGIRAALPDFKFDREIECIRWLVAAPFIPSQIEVLAAHLTIGETYFWREHHALAALEEHVLPPLIQARRSSGTGKLNLWSAACSSGEEPYSLAIMLHRLLPDIKQWQIELLATDINHSFLRKAAAGRYGKWSFRGTPNWVKENYFQQTEDGFFEVVPQIRHMVKFSHYNLTRNIETVVPPTADRLDIIFCRNVLIYMRAGAHDIIARLTSVLKEGGWLILSSVETSLVDLPELRAVNFPGAVLFQKAAVTAPRLLVSPSSPAAFRRDGVGRNGAGGTALSLKKDGPSSTTAKPSIYERRRNDPTREQTAQRVVGERRKLPTKTVADFAAPVDNTRELRTEARRYANSGRLDQALALCDRALEHDRLVAEVYYLRASILQEKGDLTESLHALQRAIYLEPAFVLAHFALGNLAKQTGQARDAELHFANALRLLQNYPADAELPESEGVRAGQLREVILSMSKSGN